MNYFFRQKSTLKATLFFLCAILISITSCKKECDCKCDVEEPEYWEHFIAHAGGEIEGVVYTNSLEAMNLSYSKGCKLFELDLVQTTDGTFIARHGYIETTEAEFMSQLIEGKYTPMNMTSIVNWFSVHRDAILVTDQIYNPQIIFDVFPFHDRLIMEMFSWEAVDKAIALGIKPLVSENVVLGWSKKAMEMGVMPTTPKSDTEIEQILEDKKIEFIGMSRYRILGNEDLLRRLKEKGIKNYVWNLGSNISGQPAEQYVWNYEMNFCYGMYADDLDLLKSLQERAAK